MSNFVPTWTAATAYLTGARVSKVSDDGLIFQAEVGGTSGNAEPTWPTTPPWTVVDNGVTWMLASSFRVQSVAGVVSVLTAFQASNPILLVQVMTARPRGASTFTMPGAWLQARSETVSFDHDIRYTVITIPVVVAVQVSDNEQAEAQMDAIMDGLRDAFTLAYHAATPVSITAQTAAADTDLPELGMAYLANIISIASTVQEGRT
jgi:hypothetical protein